MLHDMVNDILASDWMTPKQKQQQIQRAIYLMSPDAHKGCKPGENRGVIDGISHDHRFMKGMPGMGLMKGGSTDLMWMPGQGWMNMANCHHCSMPLQGNGVGDKAWGASTVSADGWTMRVRCPLCARDMSAETKGGAILTLASEKPGQPVVVFSDAAGNLTTDNPGAVFLEAVGPHERCSQWSQAFTNQAAFNDYVQRNPKFAHAKMLTFAQWSQVEPVGTPATYEKEQGPEENPYADDLKARESGHERGAMGHEK